MQQFVINPPLQASIAVRESSRRFPVRRIFCVGRNYAAHARELGNDPDREPPFFFSKPSDAVVDSNVAVPYPPQTANLHYEVELVLAIGEAGSNISVDAAMDHIWGATIGLDLTRRDVQSAAKKLGRPWDMAKGFDHSAPIAELVPIGDIDSLASGRIALEVNGELKQEGDLAEQIWSVENIVSLLSEYVVLAPGDLIMTGTPAGVGAVVPGDVLSGVIEGLASIRTDIVAPS